MLERHDAPNFEKLLHDADKLRERIDDQVGLAKMHMLTLDTSKAAAVQEGFAQHRERRSLVQ